MEAACSQTEKHLRFYTPRICHAIAVLVLGFAFYKEGPDSVRNIINLFLFPELSPLIGSKTVQLARK